MKVTMGVKPGICCPQCGDAPKLKTGFWGAAMAAAFLNRFEKEGGSVTCQRCSHKYYVQPSAENQALTR